MDTEVAQTPNQPTKRGRGRPRGKKIQPSPEVKKFEVKPSDVHDAMKATDVDFQPNELQVRFAELILTRESNWKYSELARELNVSAATISSWFNDQRFRIWVENVRHQLFMLYKPIVDQALLREAQAGSVKAMELFYALSGDLARVEAEKTEEIRNIDSLSTHDQFTRFTQTVRILTGRLGTPPSDTKDAPPRIDIQSSGSDDDE